MARVPHRDAVVEREKEPQVVRERTAGRLVLSAPRAVYGIRGGRLRVRYAHRAMELRHLEHFVAIAQEGSFTQAARRLHLSQSALSISIRALERDLGARLFERTSHDVALSDAGQALLPEARRILGCVDIARKVVGDVGSGLRGVFRVGVLQALPLVDLAEILARYHQERPLVEIRPMPAHGGPPRWRRTSAGVSLTRPSCACPAARRTAWRSPR